MITYPLSFPTFTGAAKLSPIARQVVGASTSPFTSSQKVYPWSAQWWEHHVTLPPLFGAEGAQMVAFLVSLNGVEGTFTMRDLSYRGARGAVLGTPVVSGAGQTGNTLHTSGWTEGVLGQLEIGDQFQLGTGASAHIHKVLATVNSDGSPSGEADIEIWPSLRGSPSNGASLITSNPVGLWRLTENNFQWSVLPGEEYEIQFSVREALSE